MDPLEEGLPHNQLLTYGLRLQNTRIVGGCHLVICLLLDVKKGSCNIEALLFRKNSE